MDRLHREAISLFGRQVVDLCQRIRIEDMAVEAELVAEAARQLRQEIGHPSRQKAIIGAMDAETALCLCRWIIEPDCMGRYPPIAGAGAAACPLPFFTGS